MTPNDPLERSTALFTGLYTYSSLSTCIPGLPPSSSTSSRPPVRPSPYVPGAPFIPDNLPFEPKPHGNVLTWVPSQIDARAPLNDIVGILRPERLNGKGHKNFPFEGDEVLRRRTNMMEIFLRTFKTTDLRQRRSWQAASLHARPIWKRIVRRAPPRQWTHSFIEDRERLSVNLYVTWNVSLLDEGELAQELFAHLQSVSEYVSAQNVVDYLARHDVQERYDLTRTISLTTAQRWMHLMDYRWKK